MHNKLISTQEIKNNDYDFWFMDSFESIELDIGCSHGEFLCNIASEHPRSYFVGVELVNEKCVKAEQRAIAARTDNIIIVNTEAYDFVLHSVPPSCIRAVHLYFPSPYPNRDYRLKHRLITMEFVSEIYRILKPAGILRIVTDHRGYFDQINRIIRHDTKWWPTQWTSPLQRIFDGYIVGTHWESQTKGTHPILKLQLIK